VRWPTRLATIVLLTFLRKQARKPCACHEEHSLRGDANGRSTASASAFAGRNRLCRPGETPGLSELTSGP